MHKIARFSKVAFEIGRTLPTSHLEDKSFKFFQMLPLEGFENALQAPEGSVIVTPISEPTGYEKCKTYFGYI